jgi:hypothetical protein
VLHALTHLILLDLTILIIIGEESCTSEKMSNTILVLWISHTYRGGSRDSVVGIATGYGLDDREIGVRVPVGPRIFSSPLRPDRLWDPPNLLSKGYRGLFLRR